MASDAETGRLRGEENLGEFLAHGARRTSDGWLAVIGGGGLVGFAGSLVWAGSGWMLPSAAALGLVAFGAWGISDRELRERERAAGIVTLTALRLARGLSVVAGALAALTLLFGTLALTLGRWTS